jgi:hypothetical protein
MTTRPSSRSSAAARLPPYESALLHVRSKRGVRDQFGAQVLGHRPADDPAGEPVQHDRHIYSQPWSVRCWVMSATHNRSGPGG